MQEQKTLILTISVTSLLVLLVGAFSIFGAKFANYLVSTHYVECGGKEYYDPLTGGPPSPGGPIAERTSSPDITVPIIGILGCISGAIVGIIVWRISCLIFGIDIKKVFGN